jgi:hypothetical protein
VAYRTIDGDDGTAATRQRQRRVPISVFARTRWRRCSLPLRERDGRSATGAALSAGETIRDSPHSPIAGNGRLARRLLGNVAAASVVQCRFVVIVRSTKQR